VCEPEFSPDGRRYLSFEPGGRIGLSEQSEASFVRGVDGVAATDTLVSQSVAPPGANAEQPRMGFFSQDGSMVLAVAAHLPNQRSQLLHHDVRSRRGIGISPLPARVRDLRVLGQPGGLMAVPDPNPPPSIPHASSFSPDGRLVLVPNLFGDGRTALWDPGKGSPRGEPLSIDLNSLNPAWPGFGLWGGAEVRLLASFSRDGRWLLTGEYLDGDDTALKFSADEEALPYLEAAILLQALSRLPVVPLNLEINTDWRIPRLRETATGKVARSFPVVPSLLCVAFSPDARQVLIAEPSDQIVLWDRESGQRMGLYNSPFPSQATFSEDGQSVLCGASMAPGLGGFNGSEMGYFRMLRVPIPLTGAPIAIRHRLEARTGKELTPAGEIRALSDAARQQRQREATDEP
jgi:hypothetical protein